MACDEYFSRSGGDDYQQDDGEHGGCRVAYEGEDEGDACDDEVDVAPCKEFGEFRVFDLLVGEVVLFEDELEYAPKDVIETGGGDSGFLLFRAVPVVPQVA